MAPHPTTLDIKPLLLLTCASTVSLAILIHITTEPTTVIATTPSSAHADPERAPESDPNTNPTDTTDTPNREPMPIQESVSAPGSIPTQGRTPLSIQIPAPAAPSPVVSPMCSPTSSTEPFPPFDDGTQPSDVDEHPHCSVHCEHRWCKDMREGWEWRAKNRGRRVVSELRCWCGKGEGRGKESSNGGKGEEGKGE